MLFATLVPLVELSILRSQHIGFHPWRNSVIRRGISDIEEDLSIGAKRKSALQAAIPLIPKRGRWDHPGAGADLSGCPEAWTIPGLFQIRNVE